MAVNSEAKHMERQTTRIVAEFAGIRVRWTQTTAAHSEGSPNSGEFGYCPIRMRSSSWAKRWVSVAADSPPAYESWPVGGGAAPLRKTALPERQRINPWRSRYQ